MPSPAVLARVDHLVYATCELGRGVAEIETLLGIRASPGGRHPLWGTHNALAALGRTSYLEIIAPDVDHPPSAGVHPFGLDGLGASRLVGWAANCTGLDQLRAIAARHGATLGDVLSGSRLRPDGTILRWALTDPFCVIADGIVPFFIDWGESPHPASAAPTGANLVSLRAEHPDASRVRELLCGLALALPVAAASAPALLAEIDCPNGRVLLR
jgi:Glyoxalase-like domain